MWRGVPSPEKMVLEGHGSEAVFERRPEGPAGRAEGGAGGVFQAEGTVQTEGANGGCTKSRRERCAAGVWAAGSQGEASGAWLSEARARILSLTGTSASPGWPTSALLAPAPTIPTPQPLPATPITASPKVP